MKKQSVKNTSIMPYINQDSWLVIVIFIASAIIALFTTRDNIKAVKVEIWEIDSAIEVNTKAYLGKKVTIIDARNHTLYTKGHIPTAINIELAYKENSSTLDNIRNNDIIVYCENPSCPDSRDLADKIINSFPNKRVAVYENGFEEWEKAGRKIEKGEAPKNGEVSNNGSPTPNKKGIKK